MGMIMVVGDLSIKNREEMGEELHPCCKEFLESKCSRKMTEQTSSFTDDKYYCVIDGFGYPVLENIVYCPYCGSNLVGSWGITTSQ